VQQLPRRRKRCRGDRGGLQSEITETTLNKLQTQRSELETILFDLVQSGDPVRGRNERARPRSEHRLALLRAAASYARRALSDLGHTAPGDPLAVCRAFVAAKKGSD